MRDAQHGANFCFVTDGSTVRCTNRQRFLAPNDPFFGYVRVLARLRARVLGLGAWVRQRIDTPMVAIYGELFGGTYPLQAHDGLGAGREGAGRAQGYHANRIFYTDLPHYLLEFDLYDIEDNVFLSTERRRRLLCDAPFISSVRVLHEGQLASLAALQALIGPSAFIAPDHRTQLRDAALSAGLDQAQALRETDPSGLMEGLYVKVEQDSVVTGRHKFVRADFLQTVLDSGITIQSRPSSA